MILFEKRNKDNVLIYTNITSRLYRKILELASHHRSIKNEEVKQETNNHQIFSIEKRNVMEIHLLWIVVDFLSPVIIFLLKLKTTASKFNTSFPFWSLSKFQNTVVRCSWQTFFQSLIRLMELLHFLGNEKLPFAHHRIIFFFLMHLYLDPFWICQVWSINFRASSFTIILVHFYASADILNTSAKEFEINIKEQAHTLNN